VPVDLPNILQKRPLYQVRGLDAGMTNHPIPNLATIENVCAPRRERVRAARELARWARVGPYGRGLVFEDPRWRARDKNAWTGPSPQFS